MNEVEHFAVATGTDSCVNGVIFHFCSCEPEHCRGGSQPAEGTSAEVQELLGFGTHDTAMKVVPKSHESAINCCVGVCPSS